MAKAKLHELIAVEGELEGTWKKILEEAIATFAKKPDHFIAARREVQMLSGTDEAKAEETVEVSEMTTTVIDKLDYVQGHVVRFWDAVAQKEATNQAARADLVINGVTLAKDLPATFLLGMETKLKALRAVYDAIPTLQPGRLWTLDEAYRLKNVYRGNDDVRVKTKKLTKPVVLYPATEQHPAQVKEAVEDVAVGRIVTMQWSGMLSPAEKSDLLARIDELIRACKKGRQRANGTEVVRLNVGQALMAYINTGMIGGTAPVGATTDE